MLTLHTAWVAYRAYFRKSHPPLSLSALILSLAASLGSSQSHLPLAPPHYEDHGIPLEQQRDEEERISLAGDEESEDEDSVDSVVPRDYAR